MIIFKITGLTPLSYCCEIIFYYQDVWANAPQCGKETKQRSCVILVKKQIK